METNRQRCERLGMMDEETLMEISDDRRCELCDEFCEKNLSPTNPACEGGWRTHKHCGLSQRTRKNGVRI